MDCCNDNNHNLAKEGHSDHGHHMDHKEDHGGHTMDHGSAGMFLKRFWIVTFLLIPLALTNEFLASFLGIGELALGKWAQFAIATIIFGFSLIFFQHAWHEIKAKQYGMMTLVSTAVGAGYFFSVASTFLPSIDTEFYLEIATLIWVLLFGHYLEAKSGAAAGDALQEVAKLLPRTAHLLKNDEEMEVDVSELREGDKVIVKPGEKIPADGVAIEGKASVDESLISGESKPVNKKKGVEVVAGSISLDGSLTIRLSRVGENSTIGQIQKLISDAQQTKPKSQRIADKASAILTFVAGTTALVTLLIWSFVLGESFVFAITLAITVLVIACPHALGLAIPTVTTITTSLAVKNGVFIKDLAKIETIKKADYVVLDKTGTITKGEFGVTNIVPISVDRDREVLKIAASLGALASHVIDKPIVEQAKREGINLYKVDGFSNVGGRGVKGEIEGKMYFLGNKAFMEENSRLGDKALEWYKKLSGKGETVIFTANGDNIIGIISLADEIRPDSKKAIDALHKLGVKVAMLTGDNKQVTSRVAETLGIDTYFAEVLPEDKYKHIKDLQEKGSVVLMVGDGINDAPALTQADAGIAIGAGTDVAVEAGDIVLTRDNPLDIVRLVKLSKKVYQKMIQNLVWALGYNIVAIPAAAGVFALWGFFLRPEIGALVMSLSTVIVVINALTLKRLNLKVV